MEHDDVKVGMKIWTMVGNAPAEVDVIIVNEPLSDRFRRIWVHRPCKQTTHTRHAEELFPSAEALRDYLFPTLKVTA